MKFSDLILLAEDSDDDIIAGMDEMDKVTKDYIKQLCETRAYIDIHSDTVLCSKFLYINNDNKSMMEFVDIIQSQYGKTLKDGIILVKKPGFVVAYGFNREDTDQAVINNTPAQYRKTVKNELEQQEEIVETISEVDI